MKALSEVHISLISPTSESYNWDLCLGPIYHDAKFRTLLTFALGVGGVADVAQLMDLRLFGLKVRPVSKCLATIKREFFFFIISKLDI